MTIIRLKDRPHAVASRGIVLRRHHLPRRGALEYLDVARPYVLRHEKHHVPRRAVRVTRDDVPHAGRTEHVQHVPDARSRKPTQRLHLQTLEIHDDVIGFAAQSLDQLVHRPVVVALLARARDEIAHPIQLTQCDLPRRRPLVHHRSERLHRPHAHRHRRTTAFAHRRARVIRRRRLSHRHRALLAIDAVHDSPVNRSRLRSRLRLRLRSRARRRRRRPTALSHLERSLEARAGGGDRRRAIAARTRRRRGHQSLAMARAFPGTHPPDDFFLSDIRHIVCTLYIYCRLYIKFPGEKPETFQCPTQFPTPRTGGVDA